MRFQLVLPSRLQLLHVPYDGLFLSKHHEVFDGRASHDHRRKPESRTETQKNVMRKDIADTQTM